MRHKHIKNIPLAKILRNIIVLKLFALVICIWIFLYLCLVYFQDLSYKGRHWHEACFLCWGCQNSLANQQFVAKDNGLYCPDCYDTSFAQRCDACVNTFKHG